MYFMQYIYKLTYRLLFICYVILTYLSCFILVIPAGLFWLVTGRSLFSIKKIMDTGDRILQKAQDNKL